MAKVAVVAEHFDDFQVATTCAYPAFAVNHAREFARCQAVDYRDLLHADEAFHFGLEHRSIDSVAVRIWAVEDDKWDVGFGAGLHHQLHRRDVGVETYADVLQVVEHYVDIAHLLGRRLTIFAVKTYHFYVVNGLIINVFACTSVTAKTVLGREDFPHVDAHRAQRVEQMNALDNRRVIGHDGYAAVTKKGHVGLELLVAADKFGSVFDQFDVGRGVVLSAGRGQRREDECDHRDGGSLKVYHECRIFAYVCGKSIFMSTKDFSLRIKFRALAEEVYAALTNPFAIELWSGAPAVMSTEVGSEFALWEGDIVGKNLRFVENHLVEQQWYFGDDGPVSVVTMKILDRGQTSIFEVTQTNIPADDYDDLVAGWNECYIEPLRQFLEED